MISSSHNLSCVGRRDCSDANVRSQGCLSSRAGMSLLSASCREGHVWGRLCSAGHASDTHPGETCVTRENLPARAVMHQATFHIKGRRTSAFRRSGDGTSCCHLHVGIVRSKLESSSENHDSHWPCLGNVLQGPEHKILVCRSAVHVQGPARVCPPFSRTVRSLVCMEHVLLHQHGSRYDGGCWFPKA